MENNNLLEQFGSHIFTDDVMRERIPRSVYKSFHEALEKGEPLSKEVATVIANAMKIWAIEKGALILLTGLLHLMDIQQKNMMHF